MLTFNSIEIFHRAGVVAFPQALHTQAIENLRFLIGCIGGDAPCQRGICAGALLRR